MDGIQNQLALVSRARTALAEAKTIGEAFEVRDKAEAMRRWFQLRDESTETQNLAAELSLLAERRAGAIMREMREKDELAARGGDRKSKSTTRTLILADLNISKNQASRLAALDSIPEKVFVRKVEEAKHSGRLVTTAAFVELAKDLKSIERNERKLADLQLKAVSPPDPDLGEWSIIEGDCLTLMDAVRPGSVRLVFADPPYNIGVDYGDGPRSDALSDDAYLGWCGKWIWKASRLLACDGSMWVLINDEYAAPFAMMLAETGLFRRQWLIWYETFGVNNRDGFNRCSRHLFHMVKDPDLFVFHRHAVTRPSDRQTKYNDSRANPAGKTWDSVWGVNPPIPRVVGTCDERLPEFPTQLPLALLRPIIGCATDTGDLVLDPFSGSATTGEAAIRLGRRYLGIEKNGRYVKLSSMRLKGAVRETADASEC